MVAACGVHASVTMVTDDFCEWVLTGKLETVEPFFAGMNSAIVVTMSDQTK